MTDDLDLNLDRMDAAANAQRAVDLHEPDLRRLGVVGDIIVGLDPDLPFDQCWWARAEIGVSLIANVRPRRVIVEGLASGVEALEALVQVLAQGDPRAGEPPREPEPLPEEFGP